MHVDFEKLSECWAEIPYGQYLNTVDYLLESMIGRTSRQHELAYIAECQEALCLPSECAHSIVVDNWE